MRGTFQNCGQNCVGLERLVVLEAIYDKFVADMERRVKQLRQGEPLVEDVDCGAMTMGPRSVSLGEVYLVAIKSFFGRGWRILLMEDI